MVAFRSWCISRLAACAVTSVGAANENSQEHDCDNHAATDASERALHGCEANGVFRLWARHLIPGQRANQTLETMWIPRSALAQLMRPVSTSATCNRVGTFGFLAPPSAQITSPSASPSLLQRSRSCPHGHGGTPDPNWELRRRWHGDHAQRSLNNPPILT